MDLGILHILPDIHQKNIDFSLGPTKNPGEQPHAEPLNTTAYVLIIPHSFLILVLTTRFPYVELTKLFEMLIPWPAICGPRINRYDYIHESRIFHLILVENRTVANTSNLRAGFEKHVRPSF